MQTNIHPLHVLEAIIGLGAICLITAAGLPADLWIGVFAVYCAIMVVPAFVLLAARVLAVRFVEPPLAHDPYICGTSFHK